MATDTRHERLWHALNDLHEQEKISECIKQGKTNLMDPRMPLYWRVKTLCTLVVAHDVESGWSRAEWWRSFAQDVYLDLERNQGADSTRMGDLRASLDLVRGYQALGDPVGYNTIRAGTNRMEAEAARQDVRDQIAKEEATKAEAAKDHTAKDEAAKREAAEAAKAKLVVKKQDDVGTTKGARPDKRIGPEPVKESAIALNEDSSSKAGIKHDLQNGNEASSLTRDDNLPKCGETFTDQIQLDNQALDPSRRPCDQRSHAELELGELATTTHHDDIPTIQTLKELQARQASSRQQRDLFMDGFVQRGRQRLLAIDEWEMEACECLRASQAKETTSVKIARHVEEINQLVNQKHQEEMQVAHDQGAYEAMEQELEALEARKRELLAKMNK